MHSTFAESVSHRQRLADVRCWRKGDIGEYRSKPGKSQHGKSMFGAATSVRTSRKWPATKRPVRSVRRVLGLGAVGRIRIPRRREADDRRHDSKIGAALMETVVDKRRRALLREPRPCRYEGPVNPHIPISMASLSKSSIRRFCRCKRRVSANSARPASFTTIANAVYNLTAVEISLPVYSRRLRCENAERSSVRVRNSFALSAS
jgi:hypothetical protein